jgi:hypothetical protein
MSTLAEGDGSVEIKLNPRLEEHLEGRAAAALGGVVFAVFQGGQRPQ